MDPTAKKRLPMLAKAVGTCSQLGAKYGACVSVNAQRIGKGVCQTEFQAFMQCVTTNFKK
eukprot:m.121379 g.121379  ORF g.121379 m.121379 type:complete len:60 (+) comp28850_c0_seq1:217-396(+)